MPAHVSQWWNCCQCYRAVTSSYDSCCPDCAHGMCQACDSFVFMPEIDLSHSRATYVTSGESRQSPPKETISTPETRAEIRGSSGEHLESSFGTSVTTESSEVTNTPSTFHTIPGNRNMRHFVLPKPQFSNLIDAWHFQVMPRLGEVIPHSISNPLSCHLVGRGISISDMAPTVSIFTTIALTEVEQSNWRIAITDLFPDHLRTDLEVQFQQSAFRRTTAPDPRLPPICKARNPLFYERPLRGSSIGIGGYVNQTGTLGGYLKINDVIYILTVHHILPEADYDNETCLIKGKRPLLTQASAQESAEARFTESLDNICARMKVCCSVCIDNWDKILRYCRGRRYHLREYHAREAAHLQKWAKELEGQCVLVQEAISMKQAEHSYRASTFAYLEMTSGYRSRPTCRTDVSYMVEMDWALYKPLTDRIGFNQNANQRTICWKGLGDVAAESKVYSIGRTSGYHQGIINSSMSYIDFGDHTTREWTVAKIDSEDDDLWIKSGIGIEGDSGAWIINSETEEVYGMVWGRGGEGAESKAYFTPLSEVFADIKEMSTSRGWDSAEISIA